MPSNYESVDRIRRSHRHAQPNPAENPAWANCHMDCGVLLAEIDRLEAPSNEVAWLIELQVDGRATWLTVSSVQEWTTDANEAIRFSRFTDAERMLMFMGLEGAYATEHMWCSGPSAEGPRHD